MRYLVYLMIGVGFSNEAETDGQALALVFLWPVSVGAIIADAAQEARD